MYDVAIVGSSIAGSSLAIKLADAGISVALIDKSTFPRRKACGEGLSSRGFHYLKILGLDETVLQQPHHSFYGYTLVGKHGSIHIPFSSQDSKLGTGLGIQRSVLDSLLVDAACSRDPVSVFQKTHVSDIVHEEDRYRVVTRGMSITAKHIVLAEGSSPQISKKLGVAVRRNPYNRYGLSMEFAGTYVTPPTNVHIVAEKDFEITLTPTSNTTLNLCLLGNKNVVAAAVKGQFDDLLNLKMKKCMNFEGVLSGEAIGIGPLGRSAAKAYHNDITLVGDCIETLDPLGGMGMTHALLSSSIAANAIISFLQGKESIQDALRDYDRKRNSLMKPLRGFTRLAFFSIKQMSHYKSFKFLNDNRFTQAVGQVANNSFGSYSFLIAISEVLLNSIGMF